jgi:hypothetical protein
MAKRISSATAQRMGFYGQFASIGRACRRVFFAKPQCLGFAAKNTPLSQTCQIE